MSYNEIICLHCRAVAWQTYRLLKLAIGVNILQVFFRQWFIWVLENIFKIDTPRILCVCVYVNLFTLFRFRSTKVKYPGAVYWKCGVLSPSVLPESLLRQTNGGRRNCKIAVSKRYLQNLPGWLWLSLINLNEYLLKWRMKNVN